VVNEMIVQVVAFYRDKARKMSAGVQQCIYR
jgi:hypothetical protein